jgi:hypothetical protein
MQAPQPMPTYQPAYQQMEAPRPSEGAPAGSALPLGYMPTPQYLPAPPQYAPAPEPQQAQGGGGRRYSAVARQQ